MHVSIREFKSRLSELLNRVQEGEALIVTRHGRPIARVSAATTGNELETARERLEQAPWITPPSKPRRQLGARDPLPGVANGKTLADTVAEDRG